MVSLQRGGSSYMFDFLSIRPRDEMAPVLAPMQTAYILVTGYADNVPTAPN
jgi:hypothetical protein